VAVATSGQTHHIASVTDKPSQGQPTGWVPNTEREHFMECPVCHLWFDMRDPNNIGNPIHGGKIEMVETFGPPTRAK
jgi:hypothetical protein